METPHNLCRLSTLTFSSSAANIRPLRVCITPHYRRPRSCSSPTHAASQANQQVASHLSFSEESSAASLQCQSVLVGLTSPCIPYHFLPLTLAHGYDVSALSTDQSTWHDTSASTTDITIHCHRWDQQDCACSKQLLDVALICIHIDRKRGFLFF